MQRTEQHRAGGRAAAQIVHKQRVRPTGVVQVGIACLLGKGLGVQPLQKFKVHAERAERILRRMRMQVNKAGNNEPVRIVVDRDTGKAFRQGGEDAGASAVLTDHIVAWADGERVGRAAP